MLVDTLQQFCATIQIETERIRQADTLFGYGLTIDLPGSRIKRTTAADYEALVRAFGGALSLAISINETDIIGIEQGQATYEIADGLREIQALPEDASLQLSLQIDKARIVESLQLKRDDYHVLFYFFEERLITLLHANLVQLDDELFKGDYQPTVVVVSEINYHFAGRLLTIVGERHVGDVHAQLSLKHKRTRDDIDRFRTLKTEYLNWSNFSFEHITPIHFLGHWRTGTSEAISSKLTQHLVHLLIIYTANRSNYGNSSFQCAYSNTERTVLLRLGDQEFKHNLTPILPRLMLWISGGKDNDRLTIFQSVVARELNEAEPTNNYNYFVTRQDQIFDDARWHHRVFINGKIGKHFEEFQKVADYMAQTSKQVSEAIETTTKGLTETLLATIGAILASFLAALVENKTQGVIFLISMRVFAGYLAFVAIYRMISIRQGYNLLKKESATRATIYSEVLGVHRVNPLLESLNQRKVLFENWFAVTVVVYCLLVLLIWRLSTYVPQELVNEGIIPPPTATATATATATTTATVTPTTVTAPTTAPAITPVSSGTPSP